MDPRALRTMVLLAMVTALLALAMYGAHRTLRVLEQRRCAPGGGASATAGACPPAAAPVSTRAPFSR